MHLASKQSILFVAGITACFGLSVLQIQKGRVILCEVFVEADDE